MSEVRGGSGSLAAWAAVAEQFITSDTEDEDPGRGEASAPQVPAAVGTPHRPQVPATLFQAIDHDRLRARAGCLGHVIEKVGGWLEGGRRGESLDRAVLKLADMLMDAPTALHASKEAMARVIAEPASKMETATTALADAVFHTDHYHRSNLETIIGASAAELLLYLELSKYDETPMKVAYKEPLLPQTSNTAAAEPDIRSAEAGTADMASTQAEHYMKTTSVAKLLATDNRVAMLLKLPTPSGTGHDPRPLLVIGSTLTCLQMLERATGSVMFNAISQNQNESLVASKFAMKVRSVTADMAGANSVAEKLVMGQRPADWCHLYFPCNVHIVARCHSRVFHLVDPHIQGLLHFSLSLGVGSALTRFRASLAAVLAHDDLLQVIPGSPSAEAVRYREFVIDLFCSSGGNQTLRRYLLQRLPNGDWRCRDRVQIYVTPGTDVDTAQLKTEVTTALLLVLAGKNFRIYPRHRWVGCEVATDMVGLAEAVHGLASRAYAHMLTHWKDSGHAVPATGAAAAPRGAASSDAIPREEADAQPHLQEAGAEEEGMGDVGSAGADDLLAAGRGPDRREAV